MKNFENDVASFYYTQAVLVPIIKICLLIKDYPFILEPFRDTNEKVKAIFSTEGFHLLPTVKKTTLFYDQITDCFFKILHPLTPKHKILSLLTNRARSVYNLSEYLLSKGVKVPTIMAYGLFKKGRRPFFIMKRIEGKSLYDLLIREGKTLSREIYIKVVHEVARLHRLSYWFGDAHLSHIFVNDSEVSGFIDIDNIRRNRPFSFRNLTKDLAGLNHPELRITEDEKRMLLTYYMNRLDIKKEEKFLRLLKYYTEHRWKE